jgi:Na+/melibiose symporter-like transporter
VIDRPANHRVRDTTQASWGRFALWALFGAFSAMTIVAILSIGIFVLPLTIVAGWLAHRGAPEAHSALGFISGIGAPLVLVAWLNRNDDPRAFDIAPWLATGLGLLLLGIVMFAVARRRVSRLDELG